MTARSSAVLPERNEALRRLAVLALTGGLVLAAATEVGLRISGPGLNPLGLAVAFAVPLGLLIAADRRALGRRGAWLALGLGLLLVETPLIVLLHADRPAETWLANVPGQAISATAGMIALRRLSRDLEAGAGPLARPARDDHGGDR